MQTTTITNPVERTRFLMDRAARRAFARDEGDLLGMGQIKQMLGVKDGDAVRGWLIKLVARGHVECLECSNGIYWRSTVGRQLFAAAIKPEPVDGTFILQREYDDGRGWFDAKTFTNRKRAQSALQYAKTSAEIRAREYSPAKRVQRIRLVEA